MCTFPGALLLEKISSFLLSRKFPMGTTQTQTSQRLSAKKITVENIQLCNCPHRYMTFRGTVWIKWVSENPELFIKYRQVFYSPTVTTPSQIDTGRGKGCSKDGEYCKSGSLNTPRQSKRLGY